MTTTVKPWGESHRAASGPIQIEVLNIVKGGYSSTHKHAGKHNGFVLVSGELDLITEDECYRLRKIGDSCFVAAGKEHQFVALTDVVLMEYYFGTHSALSAVDPGEITRFGTNGLGTHEELQEHAQAVENGEKVPWFGEGDKNRAYK